MSYCTKAQVKAMFRNLENSTDPAVTDASLDEFIAEADSSINARLKGVYVLPITEGTNPESFVILRKICRLLVACVVDNILNTYAEADKNRTTVSRRTTFWMKSPLRWTPRQASAPCRRPSCRTPRSSA